LPTFKILNVVSRHNFVHYCIFGPIVGPIIRFQPNSDNHLVGAALRYIHNTCTMQTCGCTYYVC